MVLGFECDPVLCESCGAAENADPLHRYDKLETGCENVAIQRGTTPRIAVGGATFKGWGNGVFALEDVLKDHFIGEYVGEKVVCTQILICPLTWLTFS